MPDCIRHTVQYTGAVQGVGFRYTVERLARSFTVTGYVRNLPDGRVELVAEGTPTELERFQTAIAETMHGYIRHADRTETPATGKFTRFGISF